MGQATRSVRRDLLLSAAEQSFPAFTGSPGGSNPGFPRYGIRWVLLPRPAQEPLVPGSDRRAGAGAAEGDTGDTVST